MENGNMSKKKEQHHERHRTRGNGDADRYTHESNDSRFKNENNSQWSITIEKINSNKPLKQLVKVAFVFFLVLAIALIIFLIPYIIKLIK